MKTLYPEISPFHSFFLPTDSVHSVYVEQVGNPQGIPVIFLHGGPCSGAKPEHRCFFDPAKYHIILMDQRGCGRSLPFGEISDNNTQMLLADMEAIRVALKLEQWLLFGGSWGGTLALLYAQQHPERVSGMIIRGVFLARQKDLDWFVQEGANRIYPEQWQRLANCVPQPQRQHLMTALYDTIWGNDELAQLRIAQEWPSWNARVAIGESFQERAAHRPVGNTQLLQVRMEIHYAHHGYFISDNQIIANCANIQHIPTTIIHGRYDLVCPLEAADALHQALPAADYIILPNAGHIAQGEAMINALVSATDNMLNRLH